MSRIIPNASTDVTEYFVMRDSTNHAPKADVTITNIDIYYQEQGAAQAAKADLTALAAADSAHADNKGYHCGNSVYRIDWPDAAFDGGIGKRVILIVVCTGCDTVYREVLLSPQVDVLSISGDATAADNAEAFFDGTGYAGTNNVIPTVTAITNGVTLANDAITAAKFDESTAFPLKYADTGATAVARTGADSDTLETLSDEITVVAGRASEIIIDTAELQTDWVNGGRLDLLIDAIKAKTDSLTFTVAGDVDCNVQTWKGATAPAMTGDAYARLGAPAGASVSADVAAVKAQTAAIETDTQDLQTQVGTDGAGLTNMPWNAAWDAEVQSECTDALNAYDPPTKTEMDTAFSTTNGKIDVIDDFLDTEIAAILADTNELQTDLVNGGRLDLLIDAIKAKTDNLPTDPADQSAVEAAITAAHSTTNSKIDAVDDYVDTEVAAILAAVDTEVAAVKAVTDKLDTAMELDGAVYRYTTNALEQAPGGTPPSAASIADAVWDEAIADHAGVGSTGAALSAAGSAGDPWATAIPGAYGAGTAGKILGDNINAPIATVDTVVDAIKAKTDSLTFTVAGDVDCNVQTWKGSTAANMTGDAYAVAADGEVGLAAIAGYIVGVGTKVDKIPKSDGTVTWNATALGSIQSECTDALNAYDPPTKAEMDSAFATTDGKIDVVDGIVDDILVDTGTTLPGTLSTLSTAVSGVAAAVWNYLTAAMTTVGSIGKAFAAWLPGTAAGAPPYTASVVAICNNALMMLGNNAITALTDDTKAAKLCTQFYQQALDSVLRAYTWNCATVRSAALTATTTPTFGFSYAFTLPADCLRVLTIEDDATIPFKVESGVLLTDESTVMISYIQRIAPTSADGLLLEAVSARLAATIAFPLTNSTSAAEAMWKLYKDKLDEAQSIDAFEGTAPQMSNDDWINSRS